MISSVSHQRSVNYTTMWCQYTPTRMTKRKQNKIKQKQKKTNVDRMSKPKLSYAAGGGVNWYTTVGKYLAVSKCVHVFTKRCVLECS